MIRLGASVLIPLLFCSVLVTGCKRKEKIRVQTDEEGAALASAIHAADPRVATQFVSGFHTVEQNQWRWTMGKFAVVLRPPAGAAEKGATLVLKFAVPDAVISKLKTVSLSASVAGNPLSAETYTQPGEFVYSREIPAKLLTGDTVKVEFTLDKSLPPGDVDARELGVIFSSVALEPK